jgi:hypothetical protein
LLDRADFFTMDLRQIATSNSWDQALNQELLRAKRVIAIDHLEHDMWNPECNSRKLKLLERCLYSNRTLVVASIADPMDFPFAIDKGEKTDESSDNQDQKAKKQQVLTNGLRSAALDAPLGSVLGTFTERSMRQGRARRPVIEEALKQSVAGMLAATFSCCSATRMPSDGTAAANWSRDKRRTWA